MPVHGIYELTQHAVPSQVGITYAEVTSPAPNTFTDPLYVLLPDWSTDFPITITTWPALHGNTLPLVGNAVQLIRDSRGDFRAVWWDGLMSFATQASLLYYLTTLSSDVSLYQQQISAPQAPKTAIPFLNLQNNQVVLNWVTQPNIPGLAFFPAGQYEFHIHAAQTLGNQVVQLFAEFWECSATGVDIAKIGTTQLSLPLTATETEYRLFFPTPEVYILASPSSRVVSRLKTTVGGIGGAAISLYVGAEADSHVVVPTVENIGDGLVSSVRTTNATPTPTNANIVIAHGATTFEIAVTGFDNPTGHACGFRIDGLARSDGATAAVVGSPTTASWSDVALSTASVALTPSGSQLEIVVTGVAGHVIDWISTVELTSTI